jgi:predicted nucleotidyltransferase
VRTARPGQSALLFLDVTEILARENIDYVIIGAFALSAHGVVRASSDVDALLYVSYPRLARISTMFEAAKFGVTLRRGDDDDPILSMLVLTDGYGNRVELLGGLRGLDPKVFSRAIEVQFYGVNLRIVGREDFIALKCFAGGPRDLEDARAAFEAAQGPVDLDLLRAVTRRFGREAADRLEEILGSS